MKLNFDMGVEKFQLENNGILIEVIVIFFLVYSTKCITIHFYIGFQKNKKEN